MGLSCRVPSRRRQWPQRRLAHGRAAVQGEQRWLDGLPARLRQCWPGISAAHVACDAICGRGHRCELPCWQQCGLLHYVGRPPRRGNQHLVHGEQQRGSAAACRRCARAAQRGVRERAPSHPCGWHDGGGDHKHGLGAILGLPQPLLPRSRHRPKRWFALGGASVQDRQRLRHLLWYPGGW